MKLLIIIPAHNEEQNIVFCLHSLLRQDYRDFEVTVVNDGSSDRTGNLVEAFIKNLPHHSPVFKLMNLETSAHQPGAKVVKTFNKGLQDSDINKFDIICKFDADIIFPENYLSEIVKIYRQNPTAGMVSGIVKIARNNLNATEDLLDFQDESGWVFENLSSKNHVRGPIKSYRVACFHEIGGLRPVLGWDNIDVMLAKMHGWEVCTVKKLWVKHLRPTAYKYKNQKAEKLGEYFYNIGLDAPLATISSAKSSFKNKSAKEFLITMRSFLAQKHERRLSQEEIKFIRKLRWQEMFSKFKN